MSSWDVDSPSTLGRQPCTPPGGPHVTPMPMPASRAVEDLLCLGDLLVRWAMAMVLGAIGRIETRDERVGAGWGRRIVLAWPPGIKGSARWESFSMRRVFMRGLVTGLAGWVCDFHSRLSLARLCLHLHACSGALPGWGSRRN